MSVVCCVCLQEGTREPKKTRPRPCWAGRSARAAVRPQAQAESSKRSVAARQRARPVVSGDPSVRLAPQEEGARAWAAGTASPEGLFCRLCSGHGRDLFGLWTESQPASRPSSGAERTEKADAPREPPPVELKPDPTSSMAAAEAEASAESSEQGAPPPAGLCPAPSGIPPHPLGSRRLCL